MVDKAAFGGIDWLECWTLGKFYESAGILPTLHESNVLDPAVQLSMTIGWTRFTLPKPTLSGLDLLLEAGLGRECKAWSWKLRENVFELF